jgi:hypothetical protein
MIQIRSDGFTVGKDFNIYFGHNMIFSKHPQDLRDIEEIINEMKLMVSMLYLRITLLVGFHLRHNRGTVVSANLGVASATWPRPDKFVIGVQFDRVEALYFLLHGDQNSVSHEYYRGSMGQQGKE